ncbi:MAG: SIS domain-containing protein [Candidatus Pelagibacter sp.]
MTNLNTFFKKYTNNLNIAITNINIKNLNLASKLILDVIKKGKTIYVCGNGGSAAIANHYVCDFIKYFRQRSKFSPKIVSLSNSIETITAIANDMNYKYIFKYQLESLYKKGDILLIVSSSGNSENVKEVLKFANKKKIKTIGFSGFKGGYLNKNSNISLYVKAMNYGISEDSHHVLMHIILQYLIEAAKNKKL